MASVTEPAKPTVALGTDRPQTPPRPLAPMAGVLSYLVPGLGQILQGRVAKGLLFLVCIYTLFFYGLYLGTGTVTLDGRTYRVSSNVYLPDTADEAPRGGERAMPALVQNLYNRPQFAGQFWVGVVAWPAIFQYLHHDRRAVSQIEGEIDDLHREIEQLKNTDPEEAERKRQELAEKVKDPRRRHPILGDLMREPGAVAVNAVHNASDKRLELAWVYTVIAGVLNILVIYDAVAGPAFGLAGQNNPNKE